MTNAGTWGWCAERGSFFYSKTQREGRRRGRPWPQIPLKVMELSRRAAVGAGCHNFNPSACLVNYYDAEGSLGLHRDDTKGEDFNLPVVTIALGDNALVDVGGLSRGDRVQSYEMNSGDVMVLWLIGRLYYHRVRRTRPGTSDLLARGGRISATLRAVRG